MNILRRPWPCRANLPLAHATFTAYALWNEDITCLHSNFYSREYTRATCSHTKQVSSFQWTSISPNSTDTMGCLSLHISVGPFSMPHIFHVMDIDPIWHMLLGRPWIHDHLCVSSSWHQCIKATPNKTGQIRIRGLRNLFAIEEAHIFEASYFIEKNVTKLARQNSVGIENP